MRDARRGANAGLRAAAFGRASIVFILYRGSSLYDPPQHGEGIYVANADGTNTRQVFQATEVYNDGVYSHPRLTADGRIIFEYQNAVTGPNGILSIPVTCFACTITNATYLAAGHNPAWTAVPIAPPSRPPVPGASRTGANRGPCGSRAT